MKRYGLILCLLLLLSSCNREDINTPVDDGVPPVQPAGLVVYYASDGVVGIEWAKNTEADIEVYNIYKSINDTSHFIKVQSTTNNYFEEYGLHYDSAYYYSVSAVDIYNRESRRSEFVNARPINRYIPYPPTFLSINARNWFDTISVNLNWYPSYSEDISGYEIFRDTVSFTSIENLSPVGFTEDNLFSDNKSLTLLQEYFYAVIAVDKGGLRSNLNYVVSDIIHDRPQLLFPENNSRLNYFYEFEVKSISVPAKYKLIIQRNELFDVIYEKIFYSSSLNESLKIELDAAPVEEYKKYYWRIVTYSPGNQEPNSFSDIYNFTIIP